MSKRRLFSSEIVESDVFLDMPPSTQSLYFHLCMNADDDGFVSPKRIMRMVGAGDDDLKILLVKRYLLSFPSGVVVIKHWLINNSIRPDRKVESTYADELATLGFKENGSYTEIEKATKAIESKFSTTTEKPAWLVKRQLAKKASSLPDSFDYKIRNAFIGQLCPVCNNVMQPFNIETATYSTRYKPLPTIQHNTPLSLGGQHELGNISVVCQSCNVSIRNKPTGKLNADLVTDTWQRLCNQSPTSRQPVAGLSKGKVSKGKVSKGKLNPELVQGGVGEKPKTKPVPISAEAINEAHAYWYERLGYELEGLGNRQACAALLRKYGTPKLHQLIDGVAKAQTDRYAPRIGDFSALKRKHSDLIAWGRQAVAKAGSGKVKKIS